MNRFIVMALILVACGDEAEEPQPVGVAVNYSVRVTGAVATITYTSTDGTDEQTTSTDEWRQTVTRPSGSTVTLKAACTPAKNETCRIAAAIKQPDGIVGVETDEVSEAGQLLVVQHSMSLE